jgi:hypothetical protein
MVRTAYMKRNSNAFMSNEEIEFYVDLDSLTQRPIIDEYSGDIHSGN